MTSKQVGESAVQRAKGSNGAPPGFPSCPSQACQHVAQLRALPGTPSERRDQQRTVRCSRP